MKTRSLSIGLLLVTLVFSAVLQAAVELKEDVPETYIVDKSGVLREKFLGPVQWDSAGARQMLMKYISQ